MLLLQNVIKKIMLQVFVDRYHNCKISQISINVLVQKLI